MPRRAAKLTPADRNTIRAKYAHVCEACGRKEWTMADLAKEYGVSVPCIHGLIHAKPTA